MLFSIWRYDPHLFHQLFDGQIRIVDGYLRIVERDEFQSISTVEATQNIDLRAAEIALAVV